MFYTLFKLSTTTVGYDIESEDVTETINYPITTNGGRHFEPQSNHPTSTNGRRQFKSQSNYQAPINEGRHFEPQSNNPIPTNRGRHFEPQPNGPMSINRGKHFKPQDTNLNDPTKIAHIIKGGDTSNPHIWRLTSPQIGRLMVKAWTI